MKLLRAIRDVTQRGDFSTTELIAFAQRQDVAGRRLAKIFEEEYPRREMTPKGVSHWIKQFLDVEHDGLVLRRRWRTRTNSQSYRVESPTDPVDAKPVRATRLIAKQTRTDSAERSRQIREEKKALRYVPLPPSVVDQSVAEALAITYPVGQPNVAPADFTPPTIQPEQRMRVGRVHRVDARISWVEERSASTPRRGRYWDPFRNP